MGKSITWIRMLVAGMLAFLAATQARAQDQAGLPADVTITLHPATAWQPRGGQIDFIVESKTRSLSGIKVEAKLGWNGYFDEHNTSLPVRVLDFDATSSSGRAVYGATVPMDFKEIQWTWPERIWGGSLCMLELNRSQGQPCQKEDKVQSLSDALRVVPVADLKVHVSGAGIDTTVVLQVGITRFWTSALLTILAVLAALIALFWMARHRKVPGEWPIALTLISTKAGYASLSQFQILLWSFVIGSGAVYVMALSGSLIDISVGALTLLGITGAATVGSKIQSANADSRNTAAPPTAAPRLASPVAPGAATGLTVIDQTHDSISLSWTAPTAGSPTPVYIVQYSDRGKANWRVAASGILGTSFRVNGLELDHEYELQVFATSAAGTSPTSGTVSARTLDGVVGLRRPQWSDLVFIDGAIGEIDVTRVQMLFFTLISAGFVAMKLFNSYTIPDIPDGFMLLMGISNGVYLTAKFVR